MTRDQLRLGEAGYAAAIDGAIEGIFEAYVAVPRELGEVVVPDVATPSRRLAEARLYDCLFADDW